ANRGCFSARTPADRSAASAAVRYRSGSATSTDAVSSADASDDPPHGDALSVTSRGRCSSASASSAVSKNEPGWPGSAKCASAVSSSSAPAASHRASPVAWCNAKRSEEHTSELQSRENLVCRLLLEKKNKGSLLLASPEDVIA